MIETFYNSLDISIIVKTLLSAFEFVYLSGQDTGHLPVRFKYHLSHISSHEDKIQGLSALRVGAKEI